MITKEKYLNALNVVEEYHRQINVEIIKHKPTNKTKIKEWDMLHRCSTRLFNVLCNICECSPNHSDFFIEDITIRQLRRTRACGMRSIEEFKQLRGY